MGDVVMAVLGWLYAKFERRPVLSWIVTVFSVGLTVALMTLGIVALAVRQ